ncbi:MAG: phosphoethanolamine--lipid A transferase [Sulfurovum sp.]|nr:phosphoethanolamine--lipid A transferase [Sulfurovum sp.]
MLAYFCYDSSKSIRGSAIKKITQIQLILITGLFLLLFDNYTFFRNVLNVYPFEENTGFVLSLGVVLFALIVLFLTLLSSKWTTKPLLIIILLVSSLTNYFMNSYHVIIDESMIRNTLQTNLSESLDLLTVKQVLYFLFLGLLPAYLVYRTPIRYRGWKRELWAKLKTIALMLLLVGASLFAYSKYYTSFFREHKPLRFNVNPLYWIYSSGKYVYLTYNSGPVIVKPIGTDAKVVDDGKPPKLVIMVVGEAARADHFSLNGYHRETNPLLEKENIINFEQMYSCGTSTAESVPCMFSVYPRSDFSYKRGIDTENVLDVLNHTGKVALLWRDNNSDSKGVAARIGEVDYRTPAHNTICTEGECRDIGMLVGLDAFIQKHQGKDILIVLHQMGNHGPAYYKRYTKDFERFTPVCQTSQLQECTRQEIVNAYDNALRYTDNFLAKTIHFLQRYDDNRSVAMLYMSDHGESLGENGIYLHGLPYFMAPDAQKHIGALFWFGKQYQNDPRIQKLQEKHTQRFSQDNLFHTLLGIFNVQTEVYDKNLDMLAQ